MDLDTSDTASLILVLSVMLLAAHSFAALLTRVRQPAVVGEIIAGLVLGPSLLGLVAPSLAAALLPPDGLAASVLAAVAELGLLLLMFITGAEVLDRPAPNERRTVVMIAFVGLTIPLIGGIALAPLLDVRDFSGPAGTVVTFVLVLGIAIAVTSIPVISRIMLDLGLLRTPFARVVLSVAALEDLVLYVLLAVALSLGKASSAAEYGLWDWFGVNSDSWSAAYHLSASLVLFALFLFHGPRLVGSLARKTLRYLERRSPVAFRLLILLASALVCVVLGVNPIFGALLSGYATKRGMSYNRRIGAASGADPAARHTSGRAERSDSWRGEGLEAIQRFALAFFIPIYFVVVGLKLDLVRNFDVKFFLWFFFTACGLKAGSVWLGARLAGVGGARRVDLAVALNARGGPGIVLATVTLSAGLINISFYTSLVLLSILTSQLAGWWLDLRRDDILNG